MWCASQNPDFWLFSVFFASVCVSKTRPERGGFFVACFQSLSKLDSVSPEEPNKPIPLPITGELDLHTFRPAEAARLLDDYFAECRQRRIHRVRIIHGKGTGTLRETVQRQLRRSPGVVSFIQGNETSGGWGATIVTLKPWAELV